MNVYVFPHVAHLSKGLPGGMVVVAHDCVEAACLAMQDGTTQLSTDDWDETVMYAFPSPIESIPSGVWKFPDAGGA